MGRRALGIRVAQRDRGARTGLGGLQQQLIGAGADHHGHVRELEHVRGDIDAVPVGCAGRGVDFNHQGHKEPFSISALAAGRDRGRLTSSAATARPARRNVAVKSRAAGSPSSRSVVRPAGASEVLDPDPVLVGPEARRRRGAGVKAEHRARGTGALPGRRPPSEIPAGGAEDRIQRRRDIAGREHVRSGRPAPTSTGIPAPVQSGVPASQSSSGWTPTPTTTCSHGVTAAVGQAHRVHAPFVSTLRRSSPRDHIDALGAVQRGEPASELVAEQRLSGSAAASIIVTSTPSLRAVAATSWPMKPAPTTSSESLSAAPRAARAHRPGAQRADVPLAVQHRQHARTASGGDQQPVVAQPPAAGQLERAFVRDRPLARAPSTSSIALSAYQC